MEEQKYILIAKVLDGEASAAEQRELQAMLDADATLRQEYEAMKAAWGNASSLWKGVDFDTSAAWQQVSGKINLAEKVDAAPKKTKQIGLPSWATYAMAAAAMLIIGIMIWKPMGSNMQTVTAATDAEVIRLADNTTVTLKQGSTLQYPETFSGAERHVMLDGEAFFEVTRNEQMPFTVDAGKASVKVLGTSFDVVNTKEEVSVTVVTGKVQMTGKAGSASPLILTPGEKGSYNNNQLNETAVTDDNYLYWKTGKLYFDNQPLQEIVRKLSVLHHVTITMGADMPEQTKSQRISISFGKQTVEDMLTELCLVSKCRFAKSGAGYIISAK